MDDIITYEDMAQADPGALMQWANSRYMVNIPTQLESVEDMQKINKLIPFLINARTFFSTAAIDLKHRTRALKATYDASKTPENKENWQLMASRKEVLENMADNLYTQYTAVSRMVTIFQEINKELRMSESLGTGFPPFDRPIK